MRKMYDDLLADGDLFSVIDGATGIWKEDRVKFKEYMHVLNDINVTKFENLT